MVMHASLRTNDDHEDHMESTRDETPSLQLSHGQLARGGSTIAADSSCRACPFCTFVCCVYDKICSSGFCVITLLTVFITARTSAYLGSL